MQKMLIPSNFVKKATNSDKPIAYITDQKKSNGVENASAIARTSTRQL
jgi:hypothetical protein